jgi:MFS family permease
MLLLGTGVGIAFPSLATLAMSGARPEDAGLASGLVNTTNQVGAAIGLAVLATISATRTQSLQHHGVATLNAMTGGYRVGFLVAAGLVVAAAVVAVTALRPSREQDEQPAGEPEEEMERVG